MAYVPGDVIWESQPWIYSVRPEKIKTHCFACLKGDDDPLHPMVKHREYPLCKLKQFAPIPPTTKMRRCSGCHYVNYCSETCQKEDWLSRHKDECPFLGAVKPIIMTKTSSSLLTGDAISVLQAVVKLKKGDVADRPGACLPPSYRTFHDLTSHADEWRQDESVAGLFKWMSLLLDVVDKDKAVVRGFDDFCSVYGKIMTNGVAVAGPAGVRDNAVASALYLGPSAVDHSCLPNAYLTYRGSTLLVRVTAEIGGLDDVRIGYIDGFQQKADRQKHLKHQYRFDCLCWACSSEGWEAEINGIRCGDFTCDHGPHAKRLELKAQFWTCQMHRVVGGPDRCGCTDSECENHNGTPQKSSIENGTDCFISQIGCPSCIPLDERAELACPTCGTVNAESLAPARKLVAGLLTTPSEAMEMRETGRVTSGECALALLLSSVYCAAGTCFLLHDTNFTLGLIYRQAAVLVCILSQCHHHYTVQQVTFYAAMALATMRKVFGPRSPSEIAFIQLLIKELIAPYASILGRTDSASQRFRQAVDVVVDTLALDKHVQREGQLEYRQWIASLFSDFLVKTVSLLIV